MRKSRNMHGTFHAERIIALIVITALCATPCFAQSGLSAFCPTNWFGSGDSEQTTYAPPYVPPAPTQIAIAPVMQMAQPAQYAYTQAAYPAPQPAMTQRTAYTPDLKYRWTYAPIARTNFVPIATQDACGNTATSYKPVTSYTVLPWLHREAYVDYKQTTQPARTAYPVTASYGGCAPCGTASYTQTLGPMGASSCSTCANGTSMIPSMSPIPTDQGYDEQRTFMKPAADPIPTPVTQERPIATPSANIIGTSSHYTPGMPPRAYTKPLPPLDTPRAIPDVEQRKAPQLIGPNEGLTAARPVFQTISYSRERLK